VLETAWKNNLASAAVLLHPAARRFTVARAHTTAPDAITLKLRVIPNKNGKRLVRNHAYRVTLRLWVSYTPTGGRFRKQGFHGLHLPPLNTTPAHRDRWVHRSSLNPVATRLDLTLTPPQAPATGCARLPESRTTAKHPHYHIACPGDFRDNECNGDLALSASISAITWTAESPAPSSPAHWLRPTACRRARAASIGATGRASTDLDPETLSTCAPRRCAT
jgi:hypothetical protein